MSESKPTLLLTVGAPRSGKSTWARSTGLPIVNPDSIRLELHGHQFFGPAEDLVWYFVGLTVRSLFRAGTPLVILDATNTTVDRRRRWTTGPWNVRYKVFDTSLEECLRRARDTGFPTDVVERMFREFQPLGPDDQLWTG